VHNSNSMSATLPFDHNQIIYSRKFANPRPTGVGTRSEVP
jgi:hypothetical protein